MRYLFILPLLLLLLGASTFSVYDSPDVGIARSGIAAVDTTSLLSGTSTITTATAVNSKTTVTLSPSNTTASATCTLVFVRGTLNPDGSFKPQGAVLADFTCDGTVKLDSSGFVATDQHFNTCGCTHFVVLVKSLSAGTLTVRRATH